MTVKIEDHDEGSLAKVEVASSADLANAIYSITHHAIEQYSQNDAFQACEIAGSASLGSVMTLALLICKKPSDLEGTGRISKERATEVYKSLTRELLVYTTLIVANQFQSIKDHDAVHMALAASFSFKLFGQALAQWQMIYPDLKIEDYVESAVAFIARKTLDEAEDLLHAQKLKAIPSAFVMRNNGSVN